MPLSGTHIPTLMGKYKVQFYDRKGEANLVFTEVGLPVTFLQTSMYWENLIYEGMGPKRGSDGRAAITFPMGDRKLPCIAAEDIGRCAYGVFKKGTELVGKAVSVAGEQEEASRSAVVTSSRCRTAHSVILSMDHLSWRNGDVIVAVPAKSPLMKGRIVHVCSS